MDTVHAAVISILGVVFISFLIASHIPTAMIAGSSYTFSEMDINKTQDVDAPEHDNNSELPPCDNSQRLALMSTKCENHTMDYYPNLKYMYIDTRHKLLFCLPAKAGCTTWKTILVDNIRKKPFIQPPVYLHHQPLLESYGIVQLSKYNQAQRAEILKTFYKVLVVRHPLDRLVSAYVDKFVMNEGKNLKTVYGGAILKLFHPNASTEAIDKGEGVTFPDFINFILSGHMDPHWKPIHSMCHPCLIRYDRVVKLETQFADALEIIREHLGPHHRGVRTHTNQATGGAMASATTRGKLLLQFVEIPQQSLRQLLKLGYGFDLDLFGYSWKWNSDGSVTAFCSNGPQGGSKCC